MIRYFLSQALKPYTEWKAKRRVESIRSGVGEGLKFSTYNASADYTLGANEYPLQLALAKHLKHGDVFYDIGANVGFFTVIGAMLVGPSGHVYAFEPIPKTAARVRHNSKLNNFQNVTVFTKAVSSSTGEGELLITSHPGGAKLSSTETPLNSEMIGKLKVDLVCVDDLVRHQNLPPPTLVKIDVEGAELEVLRGMRNTILNSKPVIIYETDHEFEKEFVSKNQEIDAFICGLGYQLKALEDSYSDIQWNVRHILAIPRPSTYLHS